MSRSENRHHRQRIIKNRTENLKHRWSYSSKDADWLFKTVRGKDNPFTRCSCWMCQNSENNKAENKKERKQTKLDIKEEME